MKTFSDFGIVIQPGATGENVRALCPQCSPGRKKQNDRCLSVNIEKETWHCHHCGWSGGLKSTGGECRAHASHRPKNYKLPEPPPKTDLPEKVKTWFKDRGISEKTLADLSIGYGPVWMPQENGKVNAINFPYFDGETIINVKYRSGKKQFRMEAGARRALYGLNDISESLVWVEGEIDKLSFWEAGFKNCVSVPDGAPSENTKNYTSKFVFLDDAEERLETVKTHIIAVDTDAPGARLKAELIRRIGPEKCFILEWPDGIKDANECLVKHGSGMLCELVGSARPAPVSGIFTLDDIQTEILDFYDYGFEKGEKTGWESVDAFYTVRVREWTVVTGIPNHGKSEWLDALIVNLAQYHGWRFGICSMENYPLSRHCAKLVEKYVGEPFRDAYGKKRMNVDKLSKSLQWAKEHFYFLHPEDDDLTVDGLLKLAKVLVYRHGIQGLVIDPWNELDHRWPREQNEVMYISSALSKIRRFARKSGVHVWVVAHPTKLQKDKSGQYPVPTPYDISGAAHWRNKADNAITVHRPNISNWKDPSVEIHVQKVRFKEIGKPGQATIYYDYVTGRYGE